MTFSRMKKRERRAVRNREQWRALVAEWKASGQTAKDFARERDMASTSLFYWSSVLRREEAVRGPARLLPVRVTAGAAALRTAQLELAVGAMRVRFDDGTAPHYVAAIARALLEASAP